MMEPSPLLQDAMQGLRNIFECDRNHYGTDMVLSGISVK
jgi:hypothetical protein